jgi:hypothetical protein
MNSEWVSFPPINRALIVTDGTHAKLCYWPGGKHGLVTADWLPLDNDYQPTHWVLLPNPPK